MQWRFTQYNGDDYMRFVLYVTKVGGRNVFWYCPWYDIDKNIFSSWSNYSVTNFINMNTPFILKNFNGSISVNTQSVIDMYFI